MKKAGRLTIALALFLGVLFMAQSGVAWATALRGDESRTQDQAAPPVLAGQADDDDRYNGGTVKPPPKEVVITKSGKYSVGGFCTLDVDFQAQDLKAVAYVHGSVPRPLPDGVHAVRQDCHVDYYQSDVLIDGLTADLGSATICFAATPKKDMTIYFYDVNGTPPTWTALPTTGENGVVCAPANGTGSYIATFKKP